jgi:hypothetical protein
MNWFKNLFGLNTPKLHHSTGSQIDLLEGASKMAGKKLEWCHVGDVLKSKRQQSLWVCMRCGALSGSQQAPNIPARAKVFTKACSHRPHFDIAPVASVDQSAEWQLISFAKCNLCGSNFTERADGDLCPSCHKKLGVRYEGIGSASTGEMAILHTPRPSERRSGQSARARISDFPRSQKAGIRKEGDEFVVYIRKDCTRSLLHNAALRVVQESCPPWVFVGYSESEKTFALIADDIPFTILAEHGGIRLRSKAPSPIERFLERVQYY